MIAVPPSSVLDRLLDPVARALTPDSARALVQLRASPEAQAHIEELAEKCAEGRLSPAEQAEYEAAVWASNFIAILQSKARALLAGNAHP
jgi:hypothetical protein